MLINIKKVTANKKDYLDLLLLADPSEKMIDKYLNKSEMFALSINGTVVSVVVVAKTTVLIDTLNINTNITPNIIFFIISS